LHWDDAGIDLDWERTIALTPVLRDVFDE